MMKNNYEIKEKLVYEGKSRIFKNWHKYGLIDRDEFLDGLKWVSNDPLNSKGMMTRELGLFVTPDMENKVLAITDPKFALPYNQNNLKGSVVKLERTYTFLDYDYTTEIRLAEDITLNGVKYHKGDLTPTHISINCRDQI